MIRSIAVIFLLALSTACIVWQSGVGLTRARASFELDCPEEQVQIHMLSGMNERGRGATFAAEGCGRRAVYVRVDQTAVARNSEIMERSEPSPAQ